MSARRNAKRLALLLGSALAALLFAELVLALAGAFPAPVSAVVVEELTEGRRGVVLRGDGKNGADARVIEARAVPADGTRRLVVVGDSTIYGTHVRERSTIPKLLAVLLTASLGGRWEALNLGREGIDARTVRQLGEAALEHLQPELLVVYTGHNEYLPPKVEPFLAVHDAPLRAALAGSLGWSRIGRALMPRDRGLRKLDELPTRVRSAQAGGILASSELEPLRATIRENYRRQLEGLTREASARGVPVILCAPTSNGREYGAIGSAFSSELSLERREQFGELLRQGYDALYAGRLDECEAAIAAAGEIDAGVAEWMHLRAALAWARGDGEEARLLDLRKWDLDESPRASSLELLAVVAEVAAATGAAYVEPGPQLERVPGPDEPRIFLDSMHPGVYGQYLIARELAVAVARVLEPGVGDLRERLPTYAAACATLKIPPAFLERSEKMTVMGDLNYASWAFDPRPYVERARAVLAGMSEEERTSGKFLLADLYLAILEENAELAMQRADQIVRTRGANAAGLLRPILNMPRLSAAIERAGLELSDSDPPRLQRVP